jgi:hypothetical protein
MDILNEDIRVGESDDDVIHLPWLPSIIFGDLFVLNSYIDKLYIKMLEFSKEID